MIDVADRKTEERSGPFRAADRRLYDQVVLQKVAGGRRTEREHGARAVHGGVAETNRAAGGKRSGLGQEQLAAGDGRVARVSIRARQYQDAGPDLGNAAGGVAGQRAGNGPGKSGRLVIAADPKGASAQKNITVAFERTDGHGRAGGRDVMRADAEVPVAKHFHPRRSSGRIAVKSDPASRAGVLDYRAEP